MSTTTTPKEAGAKSPPPRNANHPADDILTHLREYARAKPEVAALWCFGIGFLLGWKLKP